MRFDKRVNRLRPVMGIASIDNAVAAPRRRQLSTAPPAKGVLRDSPAPVIVEAARSESDAALQEMINIFADASDAGALRALYRTRTANLQKQRKNHRREASRPTEQPRPASTCVNIVHGACACQNRKPS